MFSIIDLFSEAINVDSIASVALILTISLIMIVSLFLMVSAYRKGRKINVFGIEIDSEQNLKKEDQNEKFETVDIMKSHELWNNFQGTFYAWNPSWQTELITNPSEWSDVHLRRYMDKSVERVVYAISKEPLTDTNNSKHFYLEGFKAFLKSFIEEHPSIVDKLKQKMEIYIVDKLPSNLTFFVGTGKSTKKDFSLLLINEQPFCISGTPTLAFRSENPAVVKDMLNMFHEIMNEISPTPIDELTK